METASALTLARVVHYPLPGMSGPAEVRFSPDSRLLTYLYSAEGTLRQSLWAYDIEAGTTRELARVPEDQAASADISREEAMRRERQRVRSSGITRYAWAEHQAVLLVPLNGLIYVSDSADGELRQLDSGAEAVDPQINPAGDAVAYVRDGDLWVVSLSRGARPSRLTVGASEPDTNGERVVTNGMADFVAQEEMGRSCGFWWSRDGAYLAFEQVDRSPVPPFLIVDQGSDNVAVESYRYPFAGGCNATFKLGVVAASGGGTCWFPLSVGDAEEIYLARVDWAPDGQIVVQVQSRDQKRLDVLRLNIGHQSVQRLWSEESETWINLHDDLRFVTAASGGPGEYQILWSSERSGYRHLYLYSGDGELVSQLTSGEWPVDAVVGTFGGWVYFLAGKDSPLERKLYRVALEGAQLECLTPESGMHQAVLAPSGAHLGHILSTVEHPPRLELLASDGSTSRMIFAGDDMEAKELALQPPEFRTVKAEDGTTLYGALYRPPAAEDNRHPILVSVYGGPHVQQVSNSWGMTVDLRAQYLARQGYLVWKLDNRGSARRGHRFEAAIWRNLGDIEVRDQVAGIRALTALPSADTTRVGIYGWSYGGYLTIMCLLRAPESFAAGVAGAPVTHWDGYDTHYTERYMGLPGTNTQGYRESSAMAHVSSLKAKLLFVHGMIDENVHFRHTARLISSLLVAGKPFELLPFPNERHMPRSEQGRLYMEQRLVKHFRKNLKLGTGDDTDA